MLTIVYGANVCVLAMLFHVAILAAFPMPSADDGVWSVSVIARKQRLVMQIEFPGDK